MNLKKIFDSQKIVDKMGKEKIIDSDLFEYTQNRNPKEMYEYFKENGGISVDEFCDKMYKCVQEVYCGNNE